MLSLLLALLQASLLLYFFFQAAYYCIFAGASLLSRKNRKSTSNGEPGSFTLYIPAYKEDGVILDTVERALSLDYPADKRTIVVIADSLQRSTLTSLKKLPIHLVEVSFSESTKAKAMREGLRLTTQKTDFVLVLDADNVCQKNVLTVFNEQLRNGARIVQGYRTAKNTDTPMALLDAVSEEINTAIFRRGHASLGLSAALAGSGVAMHFDLFASTVPHIESPCGCDKEMELRLLRERIRIHYNDRAIIYDEKVRSLKSFHSQRRRWFAAQLSFSSLLVDGVRELFKGNLDYADKTLQMILLPRLLFLGFLPLLTVASIILPGWNPTAWIVTGFVGYGAIGVCVPWRMFTGANSTRAVLMVPVIFSTMVTILFQLRGVSKRFLHTPHGTEKQ